MLDSKENKLLLFAILFSLFFSLIPWDYLYSNTFVDRITYYSLISYYENRINYIDYEDFFAYIKEEWLWSYITLIWSDVLNINVYLLFASITFLSVLSTLLLLIYFNKLYFSVFLFNPLYINFVYSQLRLALAISLIFFAFNFFLRKKKYFFIFFFLFSSIFIHTTSVIFIFLIFPIYFLNDKYKIYYALLYPIFIALLTGYYREVFLGYIGDRRVDYSDMTGSLYVLIIYYFFFLLSFLYLSKFKENNLYLICFSSLSLVTFSYILGSYPSRFLAASYVFCMLFITFFSKTSYRILFVLYFFYSCIGFILWIM